MQQNHNFNVEVAKKCGLLAATIFNNIGYWCDKNRVNKKHFYNDLYWTYNSRDAFVEQFPYASKPQIKLAIQKLIDSKFILVGNFNENKWDKTNWYAITAKGYSMFNNCFIEETELSHRRDINSACIYIDNNTNINTYIKEDNKSSNEDIIIKEKTAFEKYCIWVNTKMTEVAKLKTQMTEDNFKYLVQEFGKDNLIEVIEAMQNTNGITKKYTSVYLTARQWLKRRKQETNNVNNKSVML